MSNQQSTDDVLIVPMNYQQLRAEILTGSLAAALAPLVVDQNAPKQDASAKDQQIADLLNAETGTRIVEKFIDAVELMAGVGAVIGATILDKIETASASNSVLKWAFTALKSDRGINFGNAETRLMFDSLVAGGVIDITESNAMKALAELPSSVAYQAVGLAVTARDVSVALRGDAQFTPT